MFYADVLADVEVPIFSPKLSKTMFFSLYFAAGLFLFSRQGCLLGLC